MLQKLIAEYAANKAQMDALKTRNDELAEELAKLAIPGDAKTGMLEGAGYKLKIERRINERWDQGKILDLKGRCETALFDSLFRQKYEPNTAALRQYMKVGDDSVKAAILDAVTTSAGRPSIKLEKINENN